MGLGPLWVLRAPSGVADRPAGDRAASIATMDLDELAEAVKTCVACALCATRTHAVFGEGADRPQWLVVAAAPTRDDDIAGVPASGQPGRLLDAMLAAVDLSRERNAFVTTAVKCRPPGEREPLPIEIETCRPYLDRQVALMSPRLLLAVGDAATRALSGSLAGTRGEERTVLSNQRTVPAVATHHPSRLLVEPHLKAEAWADLCVARSVAARV